MSQAFVGEIRMFAGDFAPTGWAFCAGQLLAISNYDTLFNLIGTTYGGDGQTTFALPDMRGRLPVHQSANYPMGARSGAESITLTVQQIAAHGHSLPASSQPGTALSPTDAFFAASAAQNQGYGTAATVSATLNPNAVALVGGSQAHNNMQPYLCISFIISLYGIFPSQS